MFLIGIVMFTSFVNAFDTSEFDFTYSPETNYSLVNVNNSQFLQSLTPQQVADLYTETDPIWSAVAGNYVPFQFGTGNINGSGNLTTTGTGFFNKIDLGVNTISDGNFTGVDWNFNSGNLLNLNRIDYNSNAEVYVEGTSFQTIIDIGGLAAVSDSAYWIWSGTNSFSGNWVSSGSLRFNDAKKLKFGTGSDASIYYDGSNMIINPQEVGTGDVLIGNTDASQIQLYLTGTQDTIPPNRAGGSIQWGTDISGDGYTFINNARKFVWKPTEETKGTTEDKGVAWVNFATGEASFNSTTINGNLNVTGTSYLGDVVLTANDITTDYLTITSPVNVDFLIGNSTIATELAISNTVAGQATRMGLYANNGDLTDHVLFHIYGLGNITAGTNRERMDIGWNKDNLDYQIRTSALGTGVVRNLTFYTGTNTNQLLLRTDNVVQTDILLSESFLSYDNDKHYFGSAADASIYYDGTDFNINPQEYGSGDVHIVAGGIDCNHVGCHIQGEYMTLLANAYIGNLDVGGVMGTSIGVTSGPQLTIEDPLLVEGKTSIWALNANALYVEDGLGTQAFNVNSLTGMTTAKDLNVTGKLYSDNDCGIPSAMMTYERTSPSAGQPMASGNGNLVAKGDPQACSGVVTAIAGYCNGCSAGVNEVGVGLRINGVDQACDVPTLTTVDDVDSSTCSISFSKHDTVGCYTETETGAATNIRCTIYVRYD